MRVCLSRVPSHLPLRAARSSAVSLCLLVSDCAHAFEEFVGSGNCYHWLVATRGREGSGFGCAVRHRAALWAVGVSLALVLESGER